MAYHVSCWPKYRPKKPRWLGVLPVEGGTWPEIKAQLDDYAVLGVQAGKLVKQPYFREAIADPDVYVMQRPAQGITGLVVKCGKVTRYIVQADTWNVGDNDGTRPATVEEIEECWRHVELGSFPTPSALGQAVLKAEYPVGLPPIYRPQWWIWQQFHDTLVGGRVDTLVSPDTVYPTLYEHDINSAYVHFLAPLPSGPMCLYGVVKSPHAAHGGDDNEPLNWDHVKQGRLGAVSYRRYRILAHRDTFLGPLPVRDVKTDIVSYPDWGEWTGWYWNEEIEAARALGWDCRAMEGFYWKDLGSDLAAGRQRLWDLRQTAPTPAVRSLIKSASVAAIGRFAMDAVSKRVVRDAGEGQAYIDFTEGYVSGLAEVTERVDREGLLIHIASYIYMRCRMALYRKALPYAERGTLVATNYDAIYTTEKPSYNIDKIKGLYFELGGWKTKELHNAHIPNPRQLQSDEKTRLPGVRR